MPSQVTALVLLSLMGAGAGHTVTLNPSSPEAAQPTLATIRPSLSSNRPGAAAALTIAINYTGGRGGVPSPVRRAVLRLPAGMSLYIPSLRSCSAARLLRSGAHGCPERSRLGGGDALVAMQAGSQIIREHVVLRTFLGPPANLRPTFDVLAQGYTPQQRQVVFSGSVWPDSAPYGEQLRLSIPPIAPLPLEPDASITSFSLTVGAAGSRTHSAVLVPHSCPPGGFPFAAEFVYADGSSSRSIATVPCPPSSLAARAARTVVLNESGRLHLTSKHNFTLNEVGSASGTAAGTINVHLTAVSSTRVTAAVEIHAHSGSITGHGSGSYRRSGGLALFSGSMSIDRGTGRYAHIHGSGLRFSGTIAESNRDAITVHVSGRVSD